MAASPIPALFILRQYYHTPRNLPQELVSLPWHCKHITSLIYQFVVLILCLEAVTELVDRVYSITLWLPKILVIMATTIIVWFVYCDFPVRHVVHQTPSASTRIILHPLLEVCSVLQVQQKKCVILFNWWCILSLYPCSQPSTHTHITNYFMTNGIVSPMSVLAAMVLQCSCLLPLLFRLY